MPDIWSFCGECQRWYYCAPQSSTVCPVCEAEPSASEDRAAHAPLTTDPLATAPMTSSAQS